MQHSHVFPYFQVFWAETGELADDLEGIARTQDWAKGLMWCDMEGWAVQWDGTLILTDECGEFRYAPPDMFRVEWMKNVIP